jgi:hypothetical protein
MVEFEKGTLDGAYGSEFVVEIGSVGFVIGFVVVLVVEDKVESCNSIMCCL